MTFVIDDDFEPTEMAERPVAEVQPEELPNVSADNVSQSQEPQKTWKIAEDFDPNAIYGDAVTVATQADSKKAAERRYLAKLYGLSPDADDDMIAEAKVRAEQEDQLKFLTGAPTTAHYLVNNPQDASIFRQDIEKLAGVEKALALIHDEEMQGMQGYGTEDSTGDAALDAEVQDFQIKDRGMITSQTGENILAGVESGYMTGRQGSAWNNLRESGAVPDAQFIKDTIATDAALAALAGTGSDGSIRKDSAWFSAGSFVGTMAAAVVEGLQYKGAGQGMLIGGGYAGALAMAGSTTPAAPLILGAAAIGAGIQGTRAIEAGLVYKDLMTKKDAQGNVIGWNEKADRQTNAAVAEVVGDVNAIIEVAGVKIAGMAFKPFWNAAKPLIKVSPEALMVPSVALAVKQGILALAGGTGGEVATEVAQELVTALAEEFSRKNAGADVEAMTAEGLYKRLWDTAVDTFKGAGILTITGLGASIHHRMKRVRQAMHEQEFWEKVAELKTSEAAQVAPDVVHEAIAAQTEGTLNQTTYIDAVKFNEAMQKTGLTFENIQDVLPGMTQEKMDQMIANREDVEISTADMAMRLAGSDFGNAITPHIRLDKDGLSMDEANKAEEEVRRMWEAAKNGKVDEELLDGRVRELSSEELRDKYKELTDRNFEQMKASGVYANESDARLNAKYGAWLVVNLASRSKNPESVFKHAPTIVGPSTESVPQSLAQTIASQVEQVRAQYEGTDKWMKAPNGKKTKLTERQWLQVRTPSFKKWFGDWENDSVNASKVLDKNGEPIVAHHGSPEKNINIFNGDVSFFFNKESLAYQYRYKRGLFGLLYSENPGKDYSCFLSLKNPLVFEVNGKHDRINRDYFLYAIDKKHKWTPHKITADDFIDTDEAVKLAKESGKFDGVIFKDIADNVDTSDRARGDVYVSFAPNQIKSATDNNGEFSTENDDIYMQKRIAIKPVEFVEPENWRVLKRTLDNMFDDERKVFDEYIDSREDSTRIRSNLERLKDTPWAKQAIEAVFIRAAMNDLMNGREPRIQSMLDHPQMANTKNDLRRGEEGLWSRLEENGFVGDASKPAHNVNSSFINCDPSNDCAKFCYATQGNYKYAATVVKSELVSEAVRMDPKRAAEITARNYKATPEFMLGKALRLFDKGDGDETWIPYIKEMNSLGIRVQIFSKRPTFLRQVPEFNVRLLSVDESNKQTALDNPDLDIAFVYSTVEQIPFLLDLHKEGRVQVVLPVKQGRKLLDEEKIAELRKHDKTISAHICPIDAGWKEIKSKKNPDGWNCTMCDKNGGVGCFHGQSTKMAMEAAAKNEAELIKYADTNLNDLIRKIKETKGELDEQIRTSTGTQPQDIGVEAKRGQDNDAGGRNRISDVSAELDNLLKELFTRINGGTEENLSRGAVGTPDGILQGRSQALGGLEGADGSNRVGYSGKPDGDTLFQRVTNSVPKAVSDAFKQLVYHASPATFTKFDLDKVGSGNPGTVNYAWGMYFAPRRDLVEGYKKVADNEQTAANAKQILEETLERMKADWEFDEDVTLSDLDNDELRRVIKSAFYGDIDVEESMAWVDSIRNHEFEDYMVETIEDDSGKSIDELSDRELDGYAKGIIKDAQKSGNIAWSNDNYEKVIRDLWENGYSKDAFNVGESKARIYEVNIPENETLLMGDKNLEEQTETVKSALNELSKQYSIDTNGSTYSFYEKLAKKLGSQKKASLEFLKHGVQGMSITHGAPMFIVWDENAMDIVEKYSQPAYHGSPFRFDKFTLDHIGKGEGAQAHGWGLYFSLEKRVAENYRHKLTQEQNGATDSFYDWATSHKFNGKTIAEWNDYLVRNKEYGKASLVEYLDQKFDLREAVNDAREELEDGADFTEKDIQWLEKTFSDFNKAPDKYGALYTVDIPNDDVMLVEGKYFRDQPEKVKKAFLEIYNSMPESFNTDGLTVDDIHGTGKEKYNELVFEMRMRGAENPEKAASELLNKFGIKGIRYNGRSDGECAVVFDDNAITILDFFEKNPQKADEIKGWYSRSKNTIGLTANADLSTFAHEMGHWYLDTIIGLSTEADCPVSIKEDVDSLFSEFGITDWNALTDAEREQYHERWAAYVEMYLAEGKAPTKQSQGWLTRFGAWIRDVYKLFIGGTDAAVAGRFKEQFGVDLPPLSDEVRRVIDRMIAAEKDIKTAESAEGIVSLFETKPEGMTDKEWTKLMTLRDTAEAEAAGEMAKLRAKDEKWYNNARSKKLREMQAQGKEIREKVREKVKAEVEKQPGILALDAVKSKGKWLGTGDLRMNPDAVRKLGFSEGDIERLRNLGCLLNTGVTPETARTGMMHAARFKSATKMINAILAAGDKEKIIEDETTRRCMEQYSEFFDKDKREKAITHALHSEARGRFIAHELAWLANDKNIRSRVYREAARKSAEQMVMGMPIGSVNVRRFLNAEARASRDALAALKEGNRMGAVMAKRAQLVNHEAALLAIDVEKKLDNIKRLKNRVFAADKKLAKTNDIDIVNVARYVMTNIGLGKNAAGSSPADTAKKILQKLKEYGEDKLEMYQAIVDKFGYRPNYDFYNLNTGDALAAIETVVSVMRDSRNAKQITLGNRKFDRDEIVLELIQQFDAPNRKQWAPGKKHDVTPKERAAFNLMGVKAMLMRVENWCAAMDGGEDGPFSQYIYRPIANATAKFRNENSIVQKKLADLIAPRYKEWTESGPIEAEVLGYTFDTKASLIGALLHCGNASNKNKLLQGRDWGKVIDLPDGSRILDSQDFDNFILDKMLDGTITKEDVDFVQAVWDLLEETKPAAQHAFKEIYGFNFEEVEASAIQTPWGVYRGGYVPAVTVKEMVPERQTQQELTRMTQNDFASKMPVFKPGFSKTRVETYTEPLTLDIGSLCSHIQDVMRFAYIAPAATDVAKIVSDRDFAEAINSVNPQWIPTLITPWLKRSYEQSLSDGKTDLVSNALNKLRSLSGMNIMAGHIVNALQQTTGISIAAVYVKPKYLAKGFAEYVRGRSNAIENIKAASEYMKSRLDNFAYEYQSQVEKMTRVDAKFADAKGIFNKAVALDAKLDPFREWLSAHAYFCQVAMQAPIDAVVWQGAFQQEIDKGASDEDAIAFADSVVRKTQTDFSPENVAKIETGNAWQRAFLVFYNYFGMQLNLLGERWQFAKDNKKYGNFLMDATLIVWMPSVIAGLIAGLVNGDADDDDDGFDWYDAVRLMIAEPFKNVLAMVPYIGATANSAGQAAAKSGSQMAQFIWGSDPFAGKPLSSPAADLLASTASAVGNALGEKDINARKATRDTLDLLSIITRMPLGALKKPAGYTAGWIAGDIDPDDALDAMRGLISGKDVSK